MFRERVSGPSICDRMEMADPRSKAGSTQPSDTLVGSYRAVGQKIRAQLCGELGEQNAGPALLGKSAQ
jgi:hypothetical protein